MPVGLQLFTTSAGFFLCAIIRFDIELMFLLEMKLICGYLNSLKN